MKFNRAIAAAGLAFILGAASCHRAQEEPAPAQLAAPSPLSPAPAPEPTDPAPQVPAAAPAEAPPAHSPTPAAPVTLTENQKIERMLSSLTESDAVFIRNRVKYDGKQAASHLRMKWSSAGDRVKTAVDFIDVLASKSSASGKAYQIRGKDGSIVPSEGWFKELLAEIEAGK